MRVTLIALSIVFINSISVQACDICGCGIGGYYSGMLPQYHKHFIGLRWRLSNFKSNIRHETNNSGQFSREYYHSLELMGEFYPHRKVQIMPKAGIQLEHANYNLTSEYKRINTGGNQLIASLGLEIYYKRIQLGLN
jgi:hypothetical protein